MSSQPAPSPSPNTPLLERLAVKHREIAIGLIAAGVVLANLIGWINYYLYRLGSMTTVIWAVLLGSLLVLIGLAYLVVAANETAPTLPKQANNLRLVLLAGSAGLGLLTATYGIALALSAPPVYAATDYRGIFAGGIKAWRDPANGYANAWAIVRCAAAVLGGLVLMFAGLHLAKTFERTSQGLRRLLYGYNAVLSTLLIGFILLLLNVMSYSNVMPFKALGMTYDWTGAKRYSISESTEHLLTNLKEPVTVYLLLSRRDPISIDAEAFLNTCRQSSDQLSWESLSPEGNFNQVVQLMQKYRLSEPNGMLVVYGRDPNQSWEFIPQADLRAPDPKNPGVGYLFKGEEHLHKALVSLSQNKTKTVVYFTQGHGEPDLNNRSMDRRKEGLAMLADELRKRNYEVQTLKLGAGTREVPKDADIVVVADPSEGYLAEEVTALRDYLQGKGPSGKKGHLLVLSDVHLKEGRMIRTGLESLLAEYGARVQDDRLLFVGRTEGNLLNLGAVTNPDSNNPVARAFQAQGDKEPTIFVFHGPRTIEKASRPGSGVNVEPLVLAPWSQHLIRQTELSESPLAMIRDLEKRPKEARSRLLQESPTLAVAISEGNPLARVPGHESMGGEGERPRMVVFGSAGWLQNSGVARTGQLGVERLDLFASCLAWLRERADIGANVTTHQREYYKINMAPGSSRLRLILLPLALLLVAVLALGLGVWVVRRR